MDGDRYAGAIGGIPARIKDQHRTAVLQILNSTDVDKTVIERIRQQGYEQELEEYSWRIENAIRFGILLHDSEKIAKWNALTQKPLASGQLLRPEVLRRMCNELSITDPFINSLIDDYDYYTKNTTQRRPAVWAERDSWLKQAQEDGARRAN